MSICTPTTVKWGATNPAGNGIKLLNIGASLGIASYQCGVPGCETPCSRDEIGATTAIYHLGLLLLQLTKQECPIKAVRSTRTKYGDRPKLHDLVDAPDMPPHFRFVLTRMLQPIQVYRYADISLLEHDLQDVHDSYTSLSALRAAGQTAEATRQTLRDFAAFRLRVTSRNPELGVVPVARCRRMLGDLSDSLLLLPRSVRSEWKVHIQARPEFPGFPAGLQSRSLSPEGRRLLGIAEGWEEIAKSASSAQHSPTPLTKLCLYETLAIEATACLVASVAASSHISQAEVVEMRNSVLQVLGELRDRPQIELAVRPSGQQTVEISARFDNGDLQQLQQFTSWFRADYTAPNGKQAGSLKAVGLFLILFGVGCELLHSGRVVAQSKPVLQLGGAKVRGRNIWQLLKDFAALDEEIAHFEGTCLVHNGDDSGPYASQASEAWTRIAEAVTCIQKLNPAKRFAAQLYSYDFWGGEGIMRLTFPHSGESSFQRRKIFLSGYLVKEIDARRPVRVDMESVTSKELYSVLAPSEHFKELPLSDRRFSPARLARWMRGHPFQRNLALTAIGLGFPAAAVWTLGALLNFTIPPACWAIAMLPGSLALNLLANSIQAFLAAMHPEDAQLVE